MTQYIDIKINLTEKQIKKLKKAADSDRNTTLKIPYDSLRDGCISLPLTNRQINLINKKKAAKKGIQLTLSKTQLKHMDKATGGFLPLLAALIPAAIGAAGGLAGGIATAVNSTKQTNNQIEHNRQVEKILKDQVSGSGLSDIVKPIPVVGKMLSSILKEKFGLGGCVTGIKGVRWGNGLYLERKGEGLFLDRGN